MASDAIELAPLMSAILAIGRPILREFAREIVEQMSSGAVDVEIDQRSIAALQAERLTPRSYLVAAKKGKFPSKKKGRRVVAKLSDVRTWRSGGPSSHGDRVENAPIPSSASSEEDEERVLLGLRPKGALRLVDGRRSR